MQAFLPVGRAWDMSREMHVCVCCDKHCLKNCETHTDDDVLEDLLRGMRPCPAPT
jgi:hypothetical protein